MKKTRILAALLCVMMVMTIVPMMASAAETTYDSIEDILDCSLSVFKDFDLTSTAYQTGNSFVSKPTVHDAENGADISSGAFRWNNNTDNWGPAIPGERVAYFHAKVDADDVLLVFVQSPLGGGARGSFFIEADAFSENEFIELNYARAGGAGTDFVEYLIVAESDTTVALWAKGLSGVEDKWVLAARASGWNSANSPKCGIYLTGTGYAKKVTVYNIFRTYDTLGDIVDEVLGVQKDYDLSVSVKGQQSNMVTDAVTFGAENGMTLNGGYARLIQASNWSPIADGRVAYFKAKVVDASQALNVLWAGPTGSPARASVAITASGIAAGEGGITKSNGFVPGTAWVEYAVVADSDMVWSLYAKNSTTANKWMLAAQGGYGTNGGPSTGLYFSGQGHILDAIIYNPLDVVLYDALEDIVDEVLAVQKDYDLSVSIKGQDSNLVTDLVTFGAENGMTLNGGYARLIQASNWSPVADGRVAYFKAKVVDVSQALNVLWAGPTGQPARASVAITASGIADGEGGITQNNGFVPGTDWVEYAIVADSDAVWSLYAKNSVTTNKWMLAAKGGYGTNGGPSTGLYFSGQGHILDAIIYVPLVLYDTIEDIVNTEIRVQKDYDLSVSIKGQDSNLVTDLVTFSAENGMTLNGSYGRLIQAPSWSPIADGRVAYFKAKVLDASQTLNIFWAKPTGENIRAAVSVTASGIAATEGAITKNNGFVPGTDWAEYAVVADSDMVWSLYAKNSATSNKWMLAAQGGYGTNGGPSTGLYFSGQGHILDAIIYNTIFTKDLIELIDGAAEMYLYNGDTLTTPNALSVVSNGATGKVLVVTYKGNDMAKAQILDAASLTAEGTSVDASAEGATSVKVFNWNNFTQLNRVIPAITLGL